MDFNLDTINITDREFDKLRKLIYEQSGINLNDGKKALVQGRLNKLLKTGSFNSFRQYYDYLINDDGSGEELMSMLDAITTNLTSFFREERHFDYLNTSYLPNLVERRHKEGLLQVRVWSAGCSSGEEPYSLAITILENIENPQHWDLTILASDISIKMLHVAQHGRYAKERLRSLPFGTMMQYFDKSIQDKKEFYRARPLLKQLIKFRQFNLMDQFQFKRPFDIIFCRNVMIYFDK